MGAAIWVWWYVVCFCFLTCSYLVYSDERTAVAVIITRAGLEGYVAVNFQQ